MPVKIKEINNGSFLATNIKKKQFALGKHENKVITIHMVGGDNAVKQLMPTIVEKYGTNKILFHNIMNIELFEKLRGKQIIVTENGEQVICKLVKWERLKKSNKGT